MAPIIGENDILCCVRHWVFFSEGFMKHIAWCSMCCVQIEVNFVAKKRHKMCEI